ncbi:hypothetical protein ANCDUO_22780 [Ancylostoma duodenale]|uniref:Integrase catalytic domain-containing protein n=1 Tax=Ancylostoma duodenale TaxID=51022 RepID=A0A0C2FQD3_9BILA|nr:hypothetical protein ANCDUO_22780 [Ancylostoma duodenale]
MVPNLSTENFINALRRFVARRGIPETITCDNAPTFLLSEKILRAIKVTLPLEQLVTSSSNDPDYTPRKKHERYKLETKLSKPFVIHARPRSSFGKFGRNNT